MDRQYVGIDFHRRRSVIVRLSSAGERLAIHRVDNDPFQFSAVLAEAGPAPAVVVEATYGWYWVVDLLQELGATVYLANPNALNWGERRVKNDVVDATDLADMLRLGRLPQAWIAPSALRELRELVRYRAKLVQLRSGLKAQVHAVLAKEGVTTESLDMFCQRHDRGYQAVQAITGIGRTIAAILVAEIGDVSRFPSAAHLCSWAGLTPRHRESDLKTRRGRISKQGSKLLRWALIEGISRYHGGAVLAAQHRKLAERRGANKSRIATARKVLPLAYYGLRHGEIRCLVPARQAP